MDGIAASVSLRANRELDMFRLDPELTTTSFPDKIDDELDAFQNSSSLIWSSLLGSLGKTSSSTQFMFNPQSNNLSPHYLCALVMIRSCRLMLSRHLLLPVRLTKTLQAT